MNRSTDRRISQIGIFARIKSKILLDLRILWIYLLFSPSVWFLLIINFGYVFSLCFHDRGVELILDYILDFLISL